MKKYMIPALLIIGIVAAYFASFGNPFKKLINGTPPAPATSPELVEGPTVNGSFSTNAAIKQDAKGFPLMVGSRGMYVERMQQALNTRFGSDLVIDGIFGEKTRKALSAHGFNPDAIYWKHYFEILG